MIIKKLTMEAVVSGECLMLDTTVNCDSDGFIVSLLDWELSSIVHPVLINFYKKIDAVTRAEFIKFVQDELIIRCDVFNTRKRLGLDPGNEFIECVNRTPAPKTNKTNETESLNSDALNNETNSD